MYKSNLAVKYNPKPKKPPVGNIGAPDKDGNLITIPGLILPHEFYDKLNVKK